MRLFAKLQTNVLISHQWSELWFVIKKIKTSVDALDERMASWYWDVSDSDLAFVTSSQLDSFRWNVLNNHHTLWFFAGSFKNDVISVGFFKWQHFKFFVVYFNNHWEFVFANFTIKLLEVVMKSSANNFLFNFEVNPFHKAIDVNSTTWAWTFTGVKKVAFFFTFLFKTNFTGVVLCILVFWGIKLHDFAAQFTFSWGRGLDWTIVGNLADVVLNSTQFDGLAGHEFIAFGLSICIFDFSDDEVSFFRPRNVAFDWRIGFDSIRLDFFFRQLVFVNKANFNFGVVRFRFVLNLEFCQQLIFFVIEGILLILPGDDLLGWVKGDKYIIFFCKWWRF